MAETLKIVSWNINSVRAHLDHVISFLDEHNPHVLFLQETKVEDHLFPSHIIEEKGYNIILNGEKKYNGVATLCKAPLQKIERGFSWPSARFIQSEAYGLVLINLYAPNGGEIGSDKFEEKISFYENFYTYLKNTLHCRDAIIIGGDFNIVPCDEDSFETSGILSSPVERDSFRRIINLGFHDALALLFPERKGLFTWWDYRKGAFQKNHGLRIDHFLLSPLLTKDLKNGGVFRKERSLLKPSDHAPVWIDLEIGKN